MIFIHFLLFIDLTPTKTISNFYNQVVYSHALYDEKVYDVNYSWKGTIINQLELVSEHNSIVPMTFFLVNVDLDDSSLLNENVVVGYFGGYIGENLYLLENMIYPLINKTYYFFNSTMVYLEGYQVLIVEAPHQMSDRNIDFQKNVQHMIPPTDDDGTGGSGTPYFNTTFASATTINSSAILSNLWITKDFPRFYKFSFSGLNRLLVASTMGDTDVTLTLYNSNQQEIAFNDDVYDLGIDINSHIVKEQISSGTYYVKIERKSYGLIESIQFLLDSSPFQVEPNDETIPSVNTNNQVVIRDSSNSIFECRDWICNEHLEFTR